MKYGIRNGGLAILDRLVPQVIAVTEREKNPEVQRAFAKRVAKRRAKKGYR